MGNQDPSQPGIRHAGRPAEPAADDIPCACPELKVAVLVSGVLDDAPG